MPGLDGTGPTGYGPLTGRGFGPCGRGLRRGFGRRAGFGLGLGPWCRWPFAPFAEQAVLTKEEQKKILEAELREIEIEKREIEKKLKELEK